MHICMVSPEYPPYPGGVGHSVRRIAKEISSISGWCVSIMIPEFRSAVKTGVCREEIEKSSDENITVYRCKPPIHRISYNNRDQEVAFYEWLNYFIKEQHVDLVHSFYISHTGFFSGVSAHANHLPFVASIRGNDLHLNLFDSSRFPHIVWTLQNADLLTFVAASLQEIAKTIASFDTPSKVIWNSIDPLDFDENAKVAPDLQGLKGPVIGMAGDFRQKKGLDKLLTACHSLAFQATLLLIGDLNKDEREYWETKVLPEAPENIHILRIGTVPHHNMLAYYSLADIMVFPSSSDGCPNTLLEAMLAKRPVLCSDTGSMGDILRASQAGLLIDPYQPAAFASEISKLLADKELRTEYGANGESFVRKQLNIENEKNNWLTCYEEVKHNYGRS